MTVHYFLPLSPTPADGRAYLIGRKQIILRYMACCGGSFGVTSSETLPIGRQTIDILWDLSTPVVREVENRTHGFPVWAVPWTPSVAINCGLYSLRLVDVGKTRVLHLRPALELVPITTLAFLTFAPHARFRCLWRGHHWCVIRIAVDVL